jgi:hypothetical protein
VHEGSRTASSLGPTTVGLLLRELMSARTGGTCDDGNVVPTLLLFLLLEQLHQILVQLEQGLLILSRSAGSAVVATIIHTATVRETGAGWLILSRPRVQGGNPVLMAGQRPR